MKILGIGNAIVDVICKVDDEFLKKNNLTKGTMKLVFDENESHTIKQENLKTSPTPFDGKKIYGKILATYINGQVAFMNQIFKNKIIK